MTTFSSPYGDTYRSTALTSFLPEASMVRKRPEAPVKAATIWASDGVIMRTDGSEPSV